jgi:hypothetical protein
MADFGGAGTGQLMGEEFLLKRKNAERDYELNKNKQYNDDLMTQARIKANNFSLEKQAFELDLERKEATKARMADFLATQAFQNNKASRQAGSEIDSDLDLAKQLDSAATAVMAVDPKRGIEYLKQSSEFKKMSAMRATQAVQEKQAKIALAGDIASTVTDEESAQRAAAEYAKLGMDVPAKFLTWNDESAKFWENRATFSKNYVAKMRLENEAFKSTLQQQDIQSKIKERETNAKIKEQKETRLQQNIEQSKLTYKPSKEETKEVKREAELLSSSDERFANLTDEELQAAAKDVRYLTQSIMVTEGITDRSVAQAKARLQIAGRLGQDGTYKVFGANPAPVQSAPDAALAKLKANPSLAPQFKEKYGYLPEGY